MRTTSRLALTIILSAAFAGCDSAMIDISPKPEVTGRGPREPDAIGKNPGSGDVDLGEVPGPGPVETRPQGRPRRGPRPVAPPEAKAQ